MENTFSAILSSLRKDKGVSQRKAAGDLKISQALLSHYENGAREPGLNFVCRACDYYGVTADFLLGRASVAGDAGKDAAFIDLADELQALAGRAADILSEFDLR